MLSTSARLLRLLSVLRSGGPQSGAALARELGVGTRTVRRDVERLRDLGYPIEALPGAPGYRLGPEAGLPPLLLDDDEAVSVAIGLRMVRGAVAGTDAASERALDKLWEILPSRLRYRIGMMQSVEVGAADRTSVDVEALTTVARAIRERRRLRFAYEKHDGASSSRDVEPRTLVHASGRWYLVAWDVGRRDWRTFRVDRMMLRGPEGPRFAPRRFPGGDVPAYVLRGISIAPYHYKARIRLLVPARRAVERLPRQIGVVEAVDQNSSLLHTGYDSLEALAVDVASTGLPFRIEEPAELRDMARTLADRLARAAASADRSVDQDEDGSARRTRSPD